MNQATLTPSFQAFECVNPECRLRFANDLSTAQFDHCPRCGCEMRKSGEPFTNFERPPASDLAPGHTLTLVLDNLRSAQNVGSIFRTANGAGVGHIYCCGTTPTPDHRGVKKASLGAEDHTPWSYHPNCPVLVNELKQTGIKICALESTMNSISIYSLNAAIGIGKHFSLVLGNEISGVDPQVLEQADTLIHIPMAGIKTSINVAVAAGIALYWIAGHLNQLHEND